MSQLRALLSGRFKPLVWVCACFLVVSFLTRAALLWATGAGVGHSIANSLYLFGVGSLYDVVTMVYFTWPLVLVLWLMPRPWMQHKWARILVGAACLLLLAATLFVAVAEWTFWDEFQARFNFIAVDYLVYTTEVIGNIRQSYPVGKIMLALATVSAAIFFFTRRWRRIERDEERLLSRTTMPAIWLGVSLLATVLLSADMKDRSANAYVNELAGNGIYQFFAAYRNASLDFNRYYRTVPIADAWQTVREQVSTPDATFVHPTGIERRIHNEMPERRLNVVLISVESLSADFSGTYGRKDSLTPFLDSLTPQSLMFSSLWASGTRTVRGLEALSLSVPPTPGESIVKRAHNEGLFSLGHVLRSKGYDAQFLYGGYGAFDNMNYFFSNNGYDVHDRTEIPDKDIHHENIWGVADEDLYSLALNRFDADYKAGRPFFAHVMTTSNHRPYTFPSGRGPWPQGKRESAVAYTDWAIGDFIRRAKNKPWFANTVFVITADHCASSAGKAALPVFRYHIPMWIYSPGNVTPGRVDRMVSQIDIPPTMLGLLGMDYVSRFYGVDVLQASPGEERAFVGTYQLLGFLKPDRLVQLSPHRKVESLRPSFGGDQSQQAIAEAPKSTLQAISDYQTAAAAFADGSMRWTDDAVLKR